ncbi:hypothetical protein IJG72_00175 [bacterium]|nr:hypothetical protein [bacterium]
MTPPYGMPKTGLAYIKTKIENSAKRIKYEQAEKASSDAIFPNYSYDCSKEFCINPLLYSEQNTKAEKIISCDELLNESIQCDENHYACLHLDKELYLKNPKMKKLYDKFANNNDSAWLLSREKFFINGEERLNSLLTESKSYSYKNKEILSKKVDLKKLTKTEKDVIKSVIKFFEDGTKPVKHKLTGDTERQIPTLPHGMHFINPPEKSKEVQAIKRDFEQAKSKNENLTLEEYANTLDYKKRYLLNSAYQNKLLVTPKDIEPLFNSKINEYINDVKKYLPEGQQLTVGQLVALVDLRYNSGIKNFKESDVVNFLQQGDFERAADKFLSYTKADKVDNDKKAQRRLYERALFLGETDIILTPNKIKQEGLTKAD